jgi:hypothetical protein
MFFLSARVLIRSSSASTVTSDLSNEALETGICKNEIRPKIPNDCLPSLKKLMEDCWHDNPERVCNAFHCLVRRLRNVNDFSHLSLLASIATGF